jgi:fibronectin type 3 domain-containing protein
LQIAQSAIPGFFLSFFNNGGGQVVLSWQPVADAVTYIVQREDSGTTTFNNQATQAATTFYQFGLGGNYGSYNQTTYTYQVIAVDANGRQSAPSAPISTSTFTDGVATTPTNLTAVATPNGVQLHWDTPPLFLSATFLMPYQVYRSTSPDNLVNVANRISITAVDNLLDHNGLQPNTTYYYAVTARTANGESAGQNPPVQVTTLP